jgi:hypothetical protein
MGTIKLWRTFYDRYFNYYYQSSDGNFYDAQTGQAGYEISEGYEAKSIDIIVDLDSPAYIIDICSEFGVVYFDRTGKSIICQ